jgi:hypothetical protein
MTIMTDVQTEQRMEVLRQLIRDQAKAKHDRVRLEHYRKVKKAQLMKRAEQDGHHTVGAQEREAYAHPEYEKLIEGLAAATEQETESWWLLQMEQWKFDAWRTRMASERAERGRYGA